MFSVKDSTEVYREILDLIFKKGSLEIKREIPVMDFRD